MALHPGLLAFPPLGPSVLKPHLRAEKDEKHISIRSKMADTTQKDITFTLISDKGEKKEQISYIEAKEVSAQS